MYFLLRHVCLSAVLFSCIILQCTHLVRASIVDSTSIETPSSINLGFKSQPIWLEIDVEQTSPDITHYLTVGPRYVDRVQLYSADDLSTPLATFGDTLPIAETETLFGYAAKLPPSEQPKTYYLKVESDNVLQFDINVKTQAELRLAERDFMANLALVVGITAFFLIWAASNWAKSRDQLIAFFIFRQSILLVSILVQFGWFQFKLQETQSDIHNLTVVTYIFAAHLFDWQLLKRYRLPPVLSAIILALLLSYPIKLLLLATDLTTLALRINILTVLFGLLIFITATFFVSPRKTSEIPIDRKWLRVYYVLQLVTPGAMAMLAVSDIEISMDHLALLAIWYSVVQGLIIFSILNLHMRNKERQQQFLKRQVAELSVRAQIESAKHTEVSDLLAMLAHELKTPLATMKMVTAGMHRADKLDMSIQNMVEVLDTCAQLDWVESQGNTTESETIAFSELVANCQSIVDAPESFIVSGHEVTFSLDAKTLRIIIDNLVRNSIKYAKGPEPSGISWDVVGHNLVIEVFNPFPAATQLDLPQLTTKYYRHPASHRTIGTGLGLYITARLVERLNGQLELDQTDNQVIATVTIPLGTPELKHA